MGIATIVFTKCRKHHKYSLLNVYCIISIITKRIIHYWHLLSVCNIISIVYIMGIITNVFTIIFIVGI